MTQPVPARFFRFSSAVNRQYIDRYGRLLSSPHGATLKTRTGIFGITLSNDQRLLVTYPPHALETPSLPGGGREGIETHAQALQREYFEELGPFVIKRKKLTRVHQQRIFYYASDVDEYWQYDQYFYYAKVHIPKMTTSPWDTPEGGLAGWISLRESNKLTASHRLAIDKVFSKYNRK